MTKRLFPEPEDLKEIVFDRKKYLRTGKTRSMEIILGCASPLGVNVQYPLQKIILLNDLMVTITIT